MKAWVLLAAAVALAAEIGAAASAEVKPGGALEITISGYAAFQAHGGALDDQRQEPGLSTGLDFTNDTELHVILRGKHDATGIEYGANVEFAADTSDLENAGESWIFLRGGFGELRLGDEEGPVEESALGARAVAAGTGGIDGEVVAELVVDAALPSDTDVATKIRYYTPSLAGFQLGLSYTPNADDRGDRLAPRDVAVDDWVEGALVYAGEFGDVEIAASLVGSLGEAKDPDELAGEREVWTYFAGVTAEVGDLGVGAGFGDENVGGQEKRYLNVGVAYAIAEGLDLSVTHGRVLRTEGYDGVGEPWNAVASAGVELAAGVVLAGDMAYFDNDLDPGAEGFTGDDSGWAWVTRLEVAF